MMLTPLARFAPWRVAVLIALLVTAALLAAAVAGSGNDLQALTAPFSIATIMVCAAALARPSVLGDAERQAWNAAALAVFVAALGFIGALTLAVQTASPWWLVGFGVVLAGLGAVWFIAALRVRGRGRGRG